MKKVLSIIVVGLIVFIGSMVSILYGSTASAVLFINNTSPQTSYTNNSPPSTPIISGSVKGKHDVGYNFMFTSTDPNGDNVFYLIEWGDGCSSVEWLGPFTSGQTITANHTFPRGTWTISCQAEDIYNATSDWGTLKVSMPLSNSLPSMGFLERLFTRFPNTFPILRYLLGL